MNSREFEQDKLNIEDLIDVEIISKTGKAFSRMTGFSYVTTNEFGEPISEELNLPEYCQLISSSEKGFKQCKYCKRYSAEQTMIEGTTEPYECHAGLTEITAPIMASGQLIGCMVSGMVVTKNPDIETLQNCAKEYGLDYNQLVEAFKKVKVVDHEGVKKSAKFFFSLASTLSDMAFGKYMTLKANEELSRAAKLKSDFLANMSHEIRTPMNAVIGMAELALREDISPDARNYINQIKSSGRSLLTIINDILDFSKIESGKMDINPENYIPLSMFNDVANIIQTRLQDKNVELILDVDPKLPYELYGDTQRIRQVLINLLNNAAKFTHSGQIKVSVNFSSMNTKEEELEAIEEDSPFDEDNEILITEADLDAFILQRDIKLRKEKEDSADYILMEVCVQDSGIGIKQEDLSKIFNSFQQVDSKRNRNIEGTGLGLSISKRLLNMMNGNIWVESEYTVGSKFYFTLPQKVVDNNASAQVKDSEKIVAAGLFKNQYVQNQFKKDVSLLRISNCIIQKPENLGAKLEKLLLLAKGREVYFFIEEQMFTPEVQQVLQNFKSINIVLVLDFFTTEHYENLEVMILKKPLSIMSIAALLNKEEVTVLGNTNDSVLMDFGFIAPNAQILIVDDNVINLTVAEGLIEPLQMKITTAVSGPDAIEKCKKQQFDIVFMDHMMPEMDGIEATHLLRKLPGYEDSPIIALTANAIGGAKEMFLNEGFSDFIPKPIELKIMTSKVKQWLNPDLIKRKQPGDTETQVQSKKLLVADLDTEYALGLLGNKTLFWKILKEYHKNINKKCDVIIKYIQAEDWKNYTIEVHALKSSSRQIGAVLLSDKAAEMEQAGKDLNIELIKEKSTAMLEKYFSYSDVLRPFIEAQEQTKTPDNGEPAVENKIDPALLKEKLSTLIEAAGNLDSDTMETIISELEAFTFPQNETVLFQKIQEAVDNFDNDAASQSANEWLTIVR